MKKKESSQTADTSPVFLVPVSLFCEEIPRLQFMRFTPT